jgi:hypothetical protein
MSEKEYCKCGQEAYLTYCNWCGNPVCDECESGGSEEVLCAECGGDTDMLQQREATADFINQTLLGGKR